MDNKLRIPIVGKCSIEFSNNIEYAPPAYVFSDLPFEQDASDLHLPETFSNNVAIKNSRWSLTDVTIEDDYAGGNNTAASNSEATARKTLASLIASREIPFLHDPAQSKYSSESLLEELLMFAKNCNVKEDVVKSVLLAPEFVHFLGYQRLLELNGCFKKTDLEKAVEQVRPAGGSSVENGTTTASASTNIWDEDPCGVAAKEENAEKKIQLLTHLAQSVGGAWKSQQSTATQSTMVTVGINTTSPFAEPQKEDGDCTFTPQSPSQTAISCVIKSVEASDVQKVVPLSLGENRFGSGAVGNFGMPTISLQSYAKVPLSAHHFSIVVSEQRNEAALPRMKLVNYSSNGVNLVSAQTWVLGDVVDITPQDELVVGGSVSVSFTNQDDTKKEEEQEEKVKLEVDDEDVPDQKRKRLESE